MNHNKIAKELESIIESNLENFAIPHLVKNSIRIKNYAIRYNKKGFYLIYDCTNNKQVARTFFKNSAIAIAKNLACQKNIINEILRYDQDLLKHYNDAVVYKNIIKNTKDLKFKEIRRHRLEIAVDKTNHIKQVLDDYIFNF